MSELTGKDIASPSCQQADEGWKDFVVIFEINGEEHEVARYGVPRGQWNRMSAVQQRNYTDGCEEQIRDHMNVWTEEV